MVSHALPHATRILITQRVRPLVLEPSKHDDRRQQRVQRTAHQTASQSPSTVHPASSQVRRREADAQEVRTHRDLPAQQATALPLRRVHVAGVNTRETRAGQLHLRHKHPHAAAKGL